jgi:uncharacterized membrane protein
VRNLFVLGFDNEAEATVFGDKIGGLVKDHLLVLEDSAMVVLDEKGKPRVETGKHTVGVSALGGAFWGMLFGFLFLVPLAGLALGTAFGALTGKLEGMGLDKAVLEEIGNAIQPGQAGWFLLVRESTRDRVLEELAGTKARVIRTNLSEEQEKELREFFGGGEG